MNTIHQTDEFARWLKSIKDQQGLAKIIGRIGRARLGNFGDVKYFDGIGEMRIDSGPGYRLYFGKQGDTVYLLLVGGDKKSQPNDIEKAKSLWDQLKG